MIKCYHRNYEVYDSGTISEYRKNTMSFEETDDAVTVKINIMNPDFYGRKWIFGDTVGELSYTFDKKECAGKAYRLYYGYVNNNNIELGADEVFTYFSRESSSKAGYQIMNLEVLFIYFEKDTDNIYTLVRGVDVTGGALKYPVSEKEEHYFLYDTLSKLSPEFKKLFDKRNYKMKFMQDVDIYDTITYLEAQVDILTQIILSKKSEYDENLIDSLEKADKYSVLNIKPRDYLNQEFENKKKMRELQEKYYLGVDNI